MSLFNSILHGLKQKIDAQSAYKDTVVTVIKSVTNITLTPENVVSLKEGVLTLHVSPTMKMALRLKQDHLVKAFTEHKLLVKSIR